MVDINETALGFAGINAALATCPTSCRAGATSCRKWTARSTWWWRIRPTWSTGAPGPTATGGGPLGAGLAIAIVRSASERLAPGGTLLLFTGVAIERGEDPFHDEVDPDVFGEELAHAPYDRTDRIALVVLTATRPAA